MSPLIKMHAWKMAALLLVAGFGLCLHLAAGVLKTPAELDLRDIAGEGGSALLVLIWSGLLLKSRPAGRVTNLLFLGLACLFFSLWMDTVDEFIALPEQIRWDKWLESGPMPVGLILITLGIYHWHHEQLAISVQLEKRERLFREHRQFDKLIPLGTADYLRRQIELELVESRRQQRPLSLIAIDLDDFDSLNQRFGHAEGDAVLQALTQLLLLNLRRQDLLCRLAGDRFVALLPDTGESQARQIAEELRLAVTSLAHRSRQHGERLQLRASVACAMALEEDAETLLARLNQALERAKRPLALSA